MSILIPGMKMPKYGDCVVVFSDGDVRTFKAGLVVFTGREFEAENKAVELPNHGDLIDRDHLSAVGYTGTEGLDDTFDNGVAWTLEYIDKLTPVIPADPEGGADG